MEKDFKGKVYVVTGAGRGIFQEFQFSIFYLHKIEICYLC